MELNVVGIFFRWLHVISACGLVGAVFFYDVLLPVGLKGLSAEGVEAATLRCRRGLKMTVHVAFLLFLISGTYNAVKNWKIYTTNPPVMHGFFGTHVLLGLAGLTLLMIMLAGREDRPSRRGWARWAMVLLALGVAMASTLKSAREQAMTRVTVSKSLFNEPR